MTQMSSDAAFSVTEKKLETSYDIARKAIAAFPIHPDCSVTLINHSENTTFRIEDPVAGKVYALRLHRLNYHSITAIDSELAWLQALRNDAGLETPVAIPARDGKNVVAVSEQGLSRYCTLFEWMAGQQPFEGDLVSSFLLLGEVTAIIHEHSAGWMRPPWFERLSWDFNTTLGGQGHWGHWNTAPGLTAHGVNVISKAVERIRNRLDDFGQDASRFGLIHADMRLANILVEGSLPKAIDFDDCGMGWYLYDLATALSFMEERPEVNELVHLWLKGYRRVRQISTAEEEMIPTFIMLRRILVMAWIGSHAETDLAKQLGGSYTVGSIDLAELYLRGKLLG